MKGQADQKKEATKTVKKVKTTNKSAPVRLWVKAAFTGFRRSKVQQNENQALLKIQHVEDVASSRFYWGKRVAYIYKAHTLKNNTKFRTIWGRISKSHGANGVVIARFGRNLPPRAIGSTLRVFLYPNRA
ncbi:unnamed protein product [Paramecium pentaurelia]|uniref:60S ribosomal protein L35a n=1 Tax=Paramecium pentaurelia TaxID=43138 RepID=A0A8S1UEY6_9CILI|nr:unnamed protein product [Paramecium pentaurelia]